MSLHIFALNKPRSVDQYSNGAPRLSDQNCTFLSFFFSILKRDLETKKTTPNIEVCPEGARRLINRMWPMHWWIITYLSISLSPLSKTIRTINANGLFSVLANLSFDFKKMNDFVRESSVKDHFKN